MEQYVINDQEINQKQLNKITKNCNDTCKSLVKIVGIGKSSFQENRALSNAHSSPFGEIPTLNGRFKDHKEGRKMRQVVNGNVGPLRNLSEILSDIVKCFIDERDPNTIKSTEELLAALETYNSNNEHSNDEQNKFIASLDVVSLYPSLRSEDSSDEVRQIVLDSEVEIKISDEKELAIFLRKNLTTGEIAAKGLENLVPNKEMSKKQHKDKNHWIFKKETFSKKEKKVLLAEALAIAVKLAMKSNVYKFDKTLRVQKDSGGMGVTLTGVISEIKMMKWCKRFSLKLNELNIRNEVLERFVDDITLCPTAIPPGWKFEDGKMIFKEDEVEEDGKIPEDKRTMEIIKTVANSIDPLIEVTYDTPSNYNDRKIPILDVKVGMNSEKKIEYEFYQKPIANKCVTHKTSAMSIKQKMHILTQQCFSRLHNTSESISTSRTVQLLDEFMIDLKVSGYSERERKNILEGAVNTHLKLKDKETSGVRPYYRHKMTVKSVNKKNSEYKNQWFKGRNNMFKTVMFVDATPNDELIKLLRKTEEKFMIDKQHRIKFVSKTGTKLIHMFQNKDPFLENCEGNECNPCAASNKHSNELSYCKTDNVCYSAKCITCDKEGKTKVYFGETARSLHIRSREHTQLCKNKNKNSFMYKHMTSEHKNNVQDVEFEFKVERKFRKPLQRQLFEAKCIEKTPATSSLNSKDEFNYQALRKLEIQASETPYHCNVCGKSFEVKNNMKNHEKKFHQVHPCDLCKCETFGSSGLKEP